MEEKVKQALAEANCSREEFVQLASQLHAEPGRMAAPNLKRWLEILAKLAPLIIPLLDAE